MSNRTRQNRLVHSRSGLLSTLSDCCVKELDLFGGVTTRQHHHVHKPLHLCISSRVTLTGQVANLSSPVTDFFYGQLKCGIVVSCKTIKPHPNTATVDLQLTTSFIGSSLMELKQGDQTVSKTINLVTNRLTSGTQFSCFFSQSTDLFCGITNQSLSNKDTCFRQDLFSVPYLRI